MKHTYHADYLVLYVFVALVIFGFVALSSASSDLAKHDFGSAYYYIFHQALYGLTLGVVGFLAAFFTPYEKYKKFAPLILLIALAGLLLSFTQLGFTSGGATRWVNLGPFTFQPAELLKIGLIVYLAAWLSGGRGKRATDFINGFVPFIMICGFIVFLLLLQRSTSAIIILMSAGLAIYFASGARLRYVTAMIVGGILAIALLIYATPYRSQRLTTFFNPMEDIQGAGYQINQALTTIGSGGLFGVGYGNSFSKRYLPERIGDSIFAIIAEEFGFVGATALILVFLFMIVRGFLLAGKVRDPFGKLLLVGFSTVIGAQVFMHIGSISGLIPLTGVPLPFISYGGTALAIFMTIIGIMLNVSRKT